MKGTLFKKKVKKNNTVEEKGNAIAGRAVNKEVKRRRESYSVSSMEKSFN